MHQIAALGRSRARLFETPESGFTGHANGTAATPANGLNQLSSINGPAAGHDARGNLTADPSTTLLVAFVAEAAER